MFPYMDERVLLLFNMNIVDDARLKRTRDENGDESRERPPRVVSTGAAPAAMPVA